MVQTGGRRCRQGCRQPWRDLARYSLGEQLVHVETGECLQEGEGLAASIHEAAMSSSWLPTRSSTVRNPLSIWLAEYKPQAVNTGFFNKAIDACRKIRRKVPKSMEMRKNGARVSQVLRLGSIYNFL